MTDAAAAASTYGAQTTGRRAVAIELTTAMTSSSRSTLRWEPTLPRMTVSETHRPYAAARPAMTTPRGSATTLRSCTR